MIAVKLVELGSEIKEFGLEDGGTVHDLLNAAGKEYVAGTVTRNNYRVNEYDTLHDKDRIFIGNPTKGNINGHFEVTFFRIGDTSINLAASDGQTIKEVLDQLEDDDVQKKKFFREDGTPTYEFRTGTRNQQVDLDYVLSRPESGSVRIICAKKTKGNY
jgi:hypothetical protein